MWSNGDPVTAMDFVWSWKRILTASLGSQYPDMLYYLEGAYEYHNGLTDNFDDVGVKAVDEFTLKISLKAPTPFFLGLLSHYSTWPVHKETVLKHGSIDDRNGQWTRPGNFVCNGAFNLKSWELNNKIVVEKNPMYWDASEVRLNQIHFYPVSNVMTEDRMFRAGQLHVTSTLPSQKCPIYIEEKNPDLRIDPYMGQYFYRLNTENPALKDSRVRKALAYAIDRKLLVEKVTKCGQIPAYSFTPPGSNGYQPDTSIPFDPKLAKQLLTDAGYSDENPFPKLEILFNTNEDHRKLALAVQQMWQQNLGIEIELVNQDWKVYLSREMVGDFQVSRAGWIGDYEDPNTFLDLMRPNRGNNKTGWEDSKYDSLLEIANKTNNQEKRYELLKQAERILIDNMPVIPLYTYVRPYQLSSDVKGYNPHILDHHHPKFIYLERE
jgi:oligopeptide transport system substrate-binding protein